MTATLSLISFDWAFHRNRLPPEGRRIYRETSPTRGLVAAADDHVVTCLANRWPLSYKLNFNVIIFSGKVCGVSESLGPCVC